MDRALFCWLASGPVLSSLASQPHLLELRSLPDNLLDRAEGLYTRWEERYFDGPVYKRATGYRGEKAILKNVPVFFGPMCIGSANVGFSGGQAFWCLIQCDESIMMETIGVQLPCGRRSLDSVLCPAAPSAPQAPQQSQAPQSSQAPAVCEVLGHARRWHEFGHPSSMEPPPTSWWRLQKQDGSFEDAASSANGVFEFSWRLSGAAPGERFFFRADKTLRPASQPQLCMGSEGGLKNLVEGTRLILWKCGMPPYPHEEFLASLHPSSGGRIQSKTKPALCLVVREQDVSSAAGGAAGPLAMVGPCQGGQVRLHRDFTEAPDGTLRLSADLELCLRSGLDRPSDGAELRLERCSVPAASVFAEVRERKASASVGPSDSQRPADQSTEQFPYNTEEIVESAMARMLDIVRDMQTKSEDLMLSRISKLENEVTALRKERWIGGVMQSHSLNETAKADLPRVMPHSWSEL